ncbi:MAG: RNA-binding domain-containing protein [Candidatus Heimdallarchaeaceae archaeon]
MTLTISVKTPIYPTEDKEKIEKCIENLFDKKVKLKIIEERGVNFLYSSNIGIGLLKRIFSDIRQKKFLDTVRACAIIENEYTLLLYLHKQALCSKRIAVVTEDTSSPFGHIELRIQSENDTAEEILDWLAPKTEKGKEINPRSFREIYSFS